MLKKIILCGSVLLLVFFLYAFNEYRKFSKTYTGNIISDPDHSRTALLIIDIQNDLTQSGGKVHIDLKQAEQIIQNINRITNESDNRDLEIVYIKHEYTSFFFKLLLSNALVSGQPGAAFDKRLQVVNKNIFIKHVMDPFSNTQLSTFLHEKHIGYLILTGIDAGYCINKTVKSALQKGYKITVISDGIAGKTDELREKKIAEFRELGAHILTTTELLEAMNGN